MAKRLTLTQYRQENAIDLSNLFIKSPKDDIEVFIVNAYFIYLGCYGIIHINDNIDCKGEFPTEAEIEAYLKSKESKVEEIEHCHH